MIYSAYSREVELLHSRLKTRLRDDLGKQSLAKNLPLRAEILESIVAKNQVYGVLAVLEWNQRHSDLRILDSKKGDVLEIVANYMMNEVEEYDKGLEELTPNERKHIFLNDLSWYKTPEAKLKWKITGEIADVAIFAIGLLELLGANFQTIMALSYPDESGYRHSTMPKGFASQASHVLKHATYHCSKLGITLGSAIFHKTIVNEQHRSGAIHAKYTNNGYSATMRRSIGSPHDSQIPPLAQAWVGPTVLETHVFPMEEYVRIIPMTTVLEMLSNGLNIVSFNPAWPEPLGRQEKINVWRKQQE